MNDRFRLALRIAIWVTGMCLIAFLAVLFVGLMQEAPSKATAQRLTIAQTLTGCLTAVAALAATGLAIRQDRSRNTRALDVLGPKLLKEDELINRTDEMRDLFARMANGRIVACHGPRGAGKSFLLEHFADVVNGHRPPGPGHSKPKRISAALYFDLADAGGFAEVEAQICRTVLGNPESAWSDFVSFVKHNYKRRNVVLILDNVNSPGLWRDLGEAAYHYLANRPNDKLVLGSIEQVAFSNLGVEAVPVLGLDLRATKELVATRGVELSGDALAELHDECKGLPMYVRLLAAYDDMRSGHGTAVIDEQLIPDLPPNARQVLSYTALIALVDRRISLDKLKRCCPLADMEEELEAIENRTLITPVPDDGSAHCFRIHDIVRDGTLRALEPEVSEAALALFERTVESEEFEHAAIYAMFADPQAIGATRFDELLEQVIRTALQARNYALLGNLRKRASERTRALRFIAADQARTDLFCLARASELAGLGHYAQAEKELLSSSIVRTRWRRSSVSSDLQADLRFLQADIAHLLNRYDEAARMFEDLGEWAAASGRPGLQARCVWGHGHVLRHQGRDLDEALALFEQAARLADAADDLFSRAYSITGATGIKVLAGAVPADEEDLLEDIEHRIAAASKHDGYMLEVWKSQAQLDWFRGRRQAAIDTVEAAIQRALALNDRLLYNLYFERAEFGRLEGKTASALEDYLRVLDFGTDNRDRNVMANARLGIVLDELTAGTWLHHGTAEEARASVLGARDVAIDADIHVTAGVADAVAAMVDDPAPTPESIRLILL